jgi:opacity protein-like surface antigen
MDSGTAQGTKMKPNLKTLSASIIGLVVVFASTIPSFAQPNGLYLRADAGGEWTLDTHLKDFFGEPLGPDRTIKFHPGVRFGIGVGYEITDWFAAEMQTGVYANEIKSVGGASRVDEATYSNVPLLVNLRFQCPSTNCCVTPYFGGGLGVSASMIDVDHLDIGGTTLQGTASAAVFAYQAFGGLRFRLNDHMGLSVEYHYFGTTDPEWEADSTFGTGSDHMTIAGTQTHSVTVAFQYRF